MADDNTPALYFPDEELADVEETQAIDGRPASELRI
jgi:hypothetical protein